MTHQRTRTDSPREAVGDEIIERIAEQTGRDPLELPPLYDQFDPDALEALFAPTRSGTPRTGTLRFEYCGYEVTVECADAPEVTIVELSASD